MDTKKRDGDGDDNDTSDNMSDYSDSSFDPTSVESLTELLGLYEEAMMSIEESKAKHVIYLTHECRQLKPLMTEINEIADELEKFMEYEIALVSKGGNAPPAVLESVGNFGGEEEGEKGEEKKEMNHYDMIEQANIFLNVEDLQVSQFEAVPVEIWIKAKNSSGENPDELWHIHKFVNRAELMRDMYFQYLVLSRDLLALGKVRPPDVDPFYEPPNDSLIGVAYCFLDALSYKIEVHENLSIINFKGAVVGELEVEIFPSMGEDAGLPPEEKDVDGVAFTTEEFAINKYIGKKMR